ncbi:transcription termination factor Rho [Desulfocicer vacuolatum DSM 3385]|uniref:Transcription termination factor Rho n=1 Tax=Desulfocicer vacuolatum DSM 3385 TaxID=1121400 RepID=A0A1W2B837_9BACT|nr:transcription termination factor Rho [Desulfocicer vacuolatum]SMC69193.1 transcription termination factor Rho [Desulfocicer vacuolatum DSM 3385]
MKSVQGYLEIMDQGFGFLRQIENNFQPLPENTYVPNKLINRFKLSEGGFIQGTGEKKNPQNKNLALTHIDTINGVPLKETLKTVSLQDQVSINPYERLKMTMGPDDLTGKALDRIVPMGLGQRGLIIAPPKTGKTTLLRHMANAVVTNHPDTEVFILLVDERPEEVTDFKRGLKDAHVLYSSADQQIGQHMRMTRLAMHTAICCAELGRNSVVFIDSLTRMTRAFNTQTESHGRTMTGGLGANSMHIPRKIFGAARKTENGGSLTIIATILVETGSRMDDVIFQEFKGTGNMDLMLNRNCAEQRIWPAIDINQSGTRKEALLMDEEELQEISDIRRGISDMDETDAMAAFIDYLKNK